MTKCDVALGSDAEAIVSGNAASGCPAIDCIIHAGGVLKVCHLFKFKSDFKNATVASLRRVGFMQPPPATCLQARVAFWQEQRKIRSSESLAPSQCLSCVAYV